MTQRKNTGKKSNVTPTPTTKTYADNLITYWSNLRGQYFTQCPMI